jgi:geranylgeranyl diphosphate synthase type I
LERLGALRDRVNEEFFRIRAEKDYPPDLYDAAFHLIFSGGKRIRPFVLVESALLFGSREDVAMPPAVGLELLHNFTLIHDDIMDEDPYRRGVESTYEKFGVPVAITAGDALFSYLFSHIVRGMAEAEADYQTIAETIDILADASLKVCEGQAMDVLHSKYIAGESECFKMIRLKTASLFAAAGEIGAVVGGADSSQTQHMSEYGTSLGMMFQVVDDILGVLGDSDVTGKPVGNDLKRDKRTLIVLHALKNSSDGERERIMEVLGDSEAEDEEIKDVTQILVDRGSVEYAKGAADEYRRRAIQSLRALPRNEHREALSSLVELLFRRKK